MATTTKRAGARATPQAPAPPRPVRIPAPERLLSLVRLLALALVLGWVSWSWWSPRVLVALQAQPGVQTWLAARPKTGSPTARRVWAKAARSWWAGTYPASKWTAAVRS